MHDRYDSDPTNRQARRRAYTGETIVIRRVQGAASPTRRNAWRRIRRALILTGVLLAVLIALFYWQFAAAVAPLIVADARPFPPLNPPGTAINVLLIGVDERPDHPEEGVRSDTLIVVRS
ncbi:MAG: LytR family transcriptional regulator, partial [Roseiflexus sp.]